MTNKNRNGQQNMDQKESLEEVEDCEVANNDSEKNLLETDKTVMSLAEHRKMDDESMKNFSDMKSDSKDDIQSTDQTDVNAGSTENIAEGNVSVKRKRRTNDVNNEMVVDQKNCSTEGSASAAFSICVDEVTTNLSSSTVKEAEFLSQDLKLCPRITPVVSVKRKLLVLDVNGLLAYIVMPAPKECKEDIRILGRAIFKRPFSDDFLKFCFQNFDVGIWSSRSKKIINKIVDYLLGELRVKLLFCWDMEHSTQTGFKTLENSHKPLVCKELRKIWENDNPYFPWKKGDYDESNTLLLDDSPYKALLNPLHTAIFPKSYHYEDKTDNSLGPGGDLRVYLEGLLASENVQNYVKQHPFGQSAINETNVSWEFYSGVLQTLSN